MQQLHSSRPITIIAAVEGEVKKLKERILPIEQGNIGNGKYLLGKFLSKDVLIIQSGAGISRAKSVVSKVFDNFLPRIMISTGSCGALIESLRKEDVVIGSEIVFKRGGISGKGDNDTESFCPEIKLTEKVYRLLKDSSLSVWQGKILSIGKFIYQRETKKMLSQRYNVIAVEMECGGIAQIAREKGLPFIAVKVVSDELRGKLLDYNRLADFNGNLIIEKALPFFFLRPWEIFWALKFYLDLQRTYNRLYIVLEKILEVI